MSTASYDGTLKTWNHPHSHHSNRNGGYNQMAFTKFTLAKKQPDVRCNALVRVNGIESYCNTEANGKRCPAHDGSNVQKKRQEKVKQAQATSKTLDELVRWWMRSIYGTNRNGC